MKYLRKRNILEIHKELEKEYGIDPSILLPNNLESALESPKRSLFGISVFPTLTEKAATLMCDLIKLHPFLDGNKRTGLLAAIVFLRQNGRILRRNADEEVDVSLRTADCSVNSEQLADWISRNSHRG